MIVLVLFGLYIVYDLQFNQCHGPAALTGGLVWKVTNPGTYLLNVYAGIAREKAIFKGRQPVDFIWSNWPLSKMAPFITSSISDRLLIEMDFSFVTVLLLWGMLVLWNCILFYVVCVLFVYHWNYKSFSLVLIDFIHIDFLLDLKLISCVTSIVISIK